MRCTSTSFVRSPFVSASAACCGPGIHRTKVVPLLPRSSSLSAATSMAVLLSCGTDSLWRRSKA
eukprot:6144423-Lingulodinium_polyedra.AAC.1